MGFRVCLSLSLVLQLETLTMSRFSLPVCSVNNPSQCEADEFQYENLCCQLCPAGTYLREQCQRNHGKSDCPSCDPGHFMTHNNSNTQCFRCSQCREDQEEVARCSPTADRECQCKQGTYCDSENCAEKCYSCSSCPKGKVIQQCNATVDAVCDTFDSKPGLSGYQCPCFSWPLIVVVVLIVAVLAITGILIWCFCKRGE
ncbi:tumor necrosis factor receptor superfamily member 26-like [Acomys russatus]|uniref:tumor necrosis factor receptor superfamily member 26-like n=1 Tax=Acomys russatus TaxID=60746 RepID=UPI0021E2E6C0|nr:tumor necrosis factor receptor superfamily member 26-like [Acomys russatus]